MSTKNSDNQAQIPINGAQQMANQFGQNFSNTIEKMISNAEVLVLNFQPQQNQYSQLATAGAPINAW